MGTMLKYKLLLVFVAGLAAMGQVCLKASARRRTGLMQNLCDWRFLTGIALFICCPLLSIVAARHVDFSLLYIMTALNFVFVLLFSKLVLREDIDRYKLTGTLIILAGVMIYNLEGAL